MRRWCALRSTVFVFLFSIFFDDAFTSIPLSAKRMPLCRRYSQFHFYFIFLLGFSLNRNISGSEVCVCFSKFTISSGHSMRVGVDVEHMRLMKKRKSKNFIDKIAQSCAHITLSLVNRPTSRGHISCAFTHKAACAVASFFRIQTTYHFMGGAKTESKLNANQLDANSNCFRCLVATSHRKCALISKEISHISMSIALWFQWIQIDRLGQLTVAMSSLICMYYHFS